MLNQDRRNDEAQFHSKLIKFLKHNRHIFPKCYLFETKVIRLKETNFPMSELTAKEEKQLLKAKYLSVIQTHSDEARRGTNCDGSVVSGGGLIFIQRFTKPENKIFYCIDIDDFIKYRDNCPRKSLTEEMLPDVGKKFELYKIYK